ncbi:MAG TPA: SDR family oxidoreductase [Caulobacteraceae bacterium]|jgi:uncharacterized oxidoreductase|nr:SDR family oxidoreductase [Caulobacteraceae bacterium]
MNITGNTILITGGGSGIGRGLAEALQAKGNHLIIAGRREGALRETAAANPGMAWQVLDVEDAGAIREFAARIVAEHPALNVLVNNAGIMRAENLLAEPFDLADAEATITTNLLGPIRLTAALLPHLRQQPSATVINVSSGLAFLPLSMTPTYCATKAALHSYSQSLRHQLRATSVRVIELAPPAVGTDLMPTSRGNPRSMSLEDYIAESMALLRADPDADEILVERVKMLRNAEASGQYAQVFGVVNPA